MKNKNINRLFRQMKKLSMDVNDSAICGKFEILIKSGDEKDISAQLLSRILDDPFDVKDNELPELYMMYFKHYRYLRKRQSKLDSIKKDSPNSKPKSPAKLKATSKVKTGAKTKGKKSPTSSRGRAKKA